MNKSLGITAFVIAILAIFIPVLGPWMTLIVAGLAVFSTGAGFAMGMAAILISAINVILLSPTIWLSAAAGKSFGTFLVGVLVVATVVLVFRNKKAKNANALGA